MHELYADKIDLGFLQWLLLSKNTTRYYELILEISKDSTGWIYFYYPILPHKVVWVKYHVNSGKDFSLKLALLLLFYHLGLAKVKKIDNF